MAIKHSFVSNSEFGFRMNLVIAKVWIFGNSNLEISQKFEQSNHQQLKYFEATPPSLFGFQTPICSHHDRHHNHKVNKPLRVTDLTFHATTTVSWTARISRRSIDANRLASVRFLTVLFLSRMCQYDDNENIIEHVALLQMLMLLQNRLKYLSMGKKFNVNRSMIHGRMPLGNHQWKQNTALNWFLYAFYYS